MPHRPLLVAAGVGLLAAVGGGATPNLEKSVADCPCATPDLCRPITIEREREVRQARPLLARPPPTHAPTTRPRRTRPPSPSPLPF